MKPKSLPFNRNSAAAETLNLRAAKYQRHVDCADHQESLHHSGHDNSTQDEKCHRGVHFAFFPERYEPLIDDEAKEEKKKRKKEQYKKVKKVIYRNLATRTRPGTINYPEEFAQYVGWFSTNVGKALRTTWKYMMLGLYNFALSYSTPITVAATFVPDFHPGQNRT